LKANALFDAIRAGLLATESVEVRCHLDGCKMRVPSGKKLTLVSKWSLAALKLPAQSAFPLSILHEGLNVD
jgi:hypothetical protein